MPRREYLNERYSAQAREQSKGQRDITSQVKDNSDDDMDKASSLGNSFGTRAGFTDLFKEEDSDEEELATKRKRRPID